MGEDLMAYLEGKRAHGFVPRPIYSPDGDFLAFHFRNDEAYAERVDDLLTVYRSIQGHELVGCKIKGVMRLIDNLHNFGVKIECDAGKIGLSLLFLSAASVFQPEVRHYYEEMGKFSQGIPIDAKELQPV